MREAPETRQSLLLRLHNAQDHEAWTEFLEIYEPLIYRLAVKNGFQDADARELTQEVLLAVAGAIARWDPDPQRGSFRGWLFRIARNLMINFLAKRRNYPQAVGNTDFNRLLQEQPAAESNESVYFDQEYKRRTFHWAAERIRGEFREPTWQAFWQTCVEGKAVKEVAAKLKMSVGSVYVLAQPCHGSPEEGNRAIGRSGLKVSNVMVARASNCNVQRLEQLIAGDLPYETEQDIAAHVETCDACRHTLETLAAEPSWWIDTRQFLSSAEVVCRIDDSPTTGNTIELEVDGGDLDSAHDEMMVDFLAPSDNPAMLGRLGGYEILEVIGRGGMGVVFKAYDGELNRFLAIKALSPCYASSAAARKRFAREAQAAAAVVHQHVVAIHGVDGSGRLPYLVMPFVACESLQDRIDREGSLDVKDILRVAMQAAEGLAAAHAQGLVHRDVKPANILLEKGVDRVLLTDFGLARAIDDAALTRSGVIAGTPQYMSPEQAKGASIDHRTDLFSLGSVIYAMCTGRSPFRAETTMGVLRRICDSDVRPVREVNAEIPMWLEHIVAKLLAKSPADRFETADEIASLLEQCLAHIQHPTAVALPKSLTSRQSNRTLRYTVGGVIVSGCLVALLALTAMLAVNNKNLDEHSDTNGAAVQVMPEAAPAAVETSEQPRARTEQAATGVALSEDDIHPPNAWFDGLDQEMSQINFRLQQLETTDF